MTLKPGDRVRMKYYDHYAYGQITIANIIHYKTLESKVLFDGDYDLAYDYYPNNELELVKEEIKNE